MRIVLVLSVLVVLAALASADKAVKKPAADLGKKAPSKPVAGGAARHHPGWNDKKVVPHQPKVNGKAGSPAKKPLNKQAKPASPKKPANNRQGGKPKAFKKPHSRKQVNRKWASRHAPAHNAQRMSPKKN